LLIGLCDFRTRDFGWLRQRRNNGSGNIRHNGFLHNRSPAPLYSSIFDSSLWRGVTRGCADFCARSACRGLNLPLQVEKVATQSIADLHAQLGESENLLSKFVLPPEEEDGRERRGYGKQREHHE
jgi:hypothetical protein